MEADLSSIDEYVAGFFEDATVDSQGRFTVDISKRLAKLSQFQLEQPEKFILALFSSAVLIGARRFDLRRTGSGYEVLVDQPWCSPLEVDDLVAAVESGGADQGSPSLRHLGMALHFLRRLHGKGVVLELEGESLELDGPKLRRHKRQGKAGSRLKVESTLLERLFSSRRQKIYTTVTDWLQRRCQWAAMDWSAEGLKVDRQLSWMAHPEAVLTVNGGERSFRPPAARLQATLEVKDPPGLRGWALLGPEESPGSWLISAGIRYPLALKVGEHRCNYQVVLWCDQVGSDLGYEALLETQLQPIRELIPHWLGALDMARFEEELELKGWEAAAALPGADEVLWRFRQRQMHSDCHLPVRWNRPLTPLAELRLSGGFSVHQLMQAYGRRFGLPVCMQDGRFWLDDGCPVVVAGRDEKCLNLLFPRRQPFVIWNGRAVPQEGGPFGLLDYDSYWHWTPVRGDWQLGIQRLPGKHPPAILRYREARFVSGEEASSLLLPGFTLAVVGQRTPSAAEMQQAMDGLFSEAWRDPETSRCLERGLALREVWEGMREAGEFPLTRTLLDAVAPPVG